MSDDNGTANNGDQDESPPDLDEAFNAIVANLRHGDRPTEVSRWPANEDVEPTDAPSPDVEPALGSQWSGWEDLATTPSPEELVQPEDDEHYVPPPPPPIPSGDRVVRWAWTGAIGAPLVGALLAIAGWDLMGIVGLLLVAAFLGGFGTLVSRMRDGPHVDSDPDDGAVI